jgi:heme-degrading monooxygenase HmoA
MYLLVWEFYVRAGCESQFENLYGPGGDWIQLFTKADGFIKTELRRDVENSRRYLTLDYWSSKEVYESFRQQYREEYRKIDRRCEGLTERETALGAFEGLEK